MKLIILQFPRYIFSHLASVSLQFGLDDEFAIIEVNLMYVFTSEC